MLTLVIVFGWVSIVLYTKRKRKKARGSNRRKDQVFSYSHGNLFKSKKLGRKYDTKPLIKLLKYEDTVLQSKSSVDQNKPIATKEESKFEASPKNFGNIDESISIKPDILDTEKPQPANSANIENIQIFSGFQNILQDAPKKDSVPNDVHLQLTSFSRSNNCQTNDSIRPSISCQVSESELTQSLDKPKYISLDIRNYPQSAKNALVLPKFIKLQFESPKNKVLESSADQVKVGLQPQTREPSSNVQNFKLVVQPNSSLLSDSKKYPKRGSDAEEHQPNVQSTQRSYLEGGPKRRVQPSDNTESSPSLPFHKFDYISTSPIGSSSNLYFDSETDSFEDDEANPTSHGSSVVPQALGSARVTRAARMPTIAEESSGREYPRLKRPPKIYSRLPPPPPPRSEITELGYVGGFRTFQEPDEPPQDHRQMKRFKLPPRSYAR